ncbi:MAG TPA: hypothetical protein VGC76_13445 [Pyrinomonadaceae bacterium]|jgi:hypothetical protein
MKRKCEKIKGKTRISILKLCLFIFAFYLVSAPAQEKLRTHRFEMQSCIQIFYEKSVVIKDEENFLKSIRGDESRERCRENVEKIDFAKQTLLGIEINSGYCDFPLGLEYEIVKDAAKKQYLVSISYIDPKGSVCRALSRYDLWLLVPKLPEDFDVKFEVKARKSTEN